MPDLPEISAIITSYNDELNIQDTVNEVIEELSALKLTNFEILIIDDYSKDNSLSRIQELKDKRIRWFQNPKNLGQHQSILNGFMLSKGKSAVFLASDGQDNPKALKEMAAKWRAGADIVWALRKERNEPLIKKIPALVFYYILKKSKSNLPKIVDPAKADFALIDRRIINSISNSKKQIVTVHGWLLNSSFSQEQVLYKRRPRVKGRSQWSGIKKLLLALRIFREKMSG
ncbi:glycosyltransferase [Candidatus Margulisiibacteriota bacterium]